MEPDEAASLCGLIPRGGAVASASAATAAAEGVAAAVASATTPYGIPMNGWKIIFQAMLTALNVVCWLVPLRNKQISDNKLALSIANAFSGGVFLSLAFGHLIPECIHGFAEYNEATPFMLVLGGYLLIFFVEKVAFDTDGVLHEMEQNGGQVQLQKVNGVAGGAVATAKTEATKSPTADAVASSGRSAVILLAALAVHSILEMTALGLADTFGDSALLTLSIALHQVWK